MHILIGIPHHLSEFTTAAHIFESTQFVKEQLNSGWDSSTDFNAENLYWCLMTIDEYGEIFEDDLFYEVRLDD